MSPNLFCCKKIIHNLYHGKSSPLMWTTSVTLKILTKVNHFFKEVARGGERTRVLSLSFIFSFSPLYRWATAAPQVNHYSMGENSPNLVTLHSRESDKRGLLFYAKSKPLCEWWTILFLRFIQLKNESTTGTECKRGVIFVHVYDAMMKTGLHSWRRGPSFKTHVKFSGP
jgi:hypothetical protein